MCPLIDNQFIAIVFFLAFIVGILINIKVINVSHNIYFIALIVDFALVYLLRNKLSFIMRIEYKLLLVVGVFLLSYLVRPLFKTWNKYMLFNYSDTANDKIKKLSDKFGVEIITEVNKTKDWVLQINANYDKIYVKEINKMIRENGKTSLFSVIILVVLLFLGVYFYIN